MEKFLYWVLGGMAAICAALVGAIRHLDLKRFTKIEKQIHDLRNEMQIIQSKLPSDFERQEINRQRDNIAKIFDRLTEMQEQMHQHHVDLLEALSRKADR